LGLKGLKDVFMPPRVYGLHTGGVNLSDRTVNIEGHIEEEFV